MSKSLVTAAPSLARAFETERDALRQRLVQDEPSPTQTVSEARRALDRTGAVFTQEVTDPKVQKAGLWLLEMIKSGAGTIDEGAGAEIIWREVPQPKTRQWAGRTLYYGAAGVFAVAGFVQGSGLVMLTAAALAVLRFFDPKDWSHLKDKIPFVKKTPGIEDQNGCRHLAEARITVNPGGFVDSLSDALKTADHILLRLAEPDVETHWRDDARLMQLVQGLLEARIANDGDFALRLIGQELESVLSAEGIELLEYSQQTQDYFDILPAIGASETRMAMPALKADGQVIRRGTIWQSDDG